jgi:putative protease
VTADLLLLLNYHTIPLHNYNEGEIKMELLAPAGSFDALKAAVNAGANAVYLAGNNFGARAYAENFSQEILTDAVKFAHLHGVSIHVTTNTILNDDETENFAEYIKLLKRANVDALLVQDLGAAKIIKSVAPEIPLHASTQMTVHNLAGVEKLAELGFSRVVLSREMTLAEIENIAKNSPVEIEIFAHGALCVCFSGQCLMSSMIGGRSGNRGRCAQPCRLPYTLVDDKGNELLKTAGEYLLSPKDLNTLELLPRLVAAGVDSLKIEGRMKRAEYVATVVKIYRDALDRIQNFSANDSNADEISMSAEKISDSENNGVSNFSANVSNAD